MVFCDGPDYSIGNRKEEETIYREKILPLMARGKYDEANEIVSKNAGIVDCLDGLELRTLYLCSLRQTLLREGDKKVRDLGGKIKW